MMLRKQLLFIAGLFLFTQQWGSAQVKSTNQYLSKVGVPDSLYSDILGETREIYIQIPVTYKSGNNQKYPVIYIIDGEVFLPAVHEVLNYYSGGFMPEMVLVGISNSRDRLRDLTTSKVSSIYGMPFNKENGEAENFIEFIGTELIPYIESKYPVSNYRTLIGHSYGGLFTISSLLKHSSLFANYLAIDPSLDWDEQKLLKQVESLLASQSFENKFLFMSLSSQLHMQDSKVSIHNVMQDSSEFTLFARSNIDFANLVRQNPENGLSFDWKYYPRNLHGTVPLPSIMDGLISIFEWYQMENTDKINSFDTPEEELLSIIRHRAKKLEDHLGYPEPPYPEELLNMSAYMSMDMKQPAKAKMYFELAMEYYPQSPNAYDSMADFYEAQGDYTKALKFESKAFKLSPQEYYKNRMNEFKKKGDGIGNQENQ
jgi:predicted alpha/beta superfamily hydrolase